MLQNNENLRSKWISDEHYCPIDLGIPSTLIFRELKTLFLFNCSQDHERHLKHLDSINAVHGLLKWRLQSCRLYFNLPFGVIILRHWRWQRQGKFHILSTLL